MKNFVRAIAIYIEDFEKGPLNNDWETIEKALKSELNKSETKSALHTQYNSMITIEWKAGKRNVHISIKVPLRANL